MEICEHGFYRLSSKGGRSSFGSENLSAGKLTLHSFIGRTTRPRERKGSYCGVVRSAMDLAPGMGDRFCSSKWWEGSEKWVAKASHSFARSQK